MPERTSHEIDVRIGRVVDSSLPKAAGLSEAQLKKLAASVKTINTSLSPRLQPPARVLRRASAAYRVAISKQRA
jgi:hypothetical protein